MKPSDEILKFLEEETNKGNVDIDLTQFFNESKLTNYDFLKILTDLQDKGYIKFKSSPDTLKIITGYIRNIFNKIIGVNFGEIYVYKFEARLLPDRINNYKITE